MVFLHLYFNILTIILHTCIFYFILKLVFLILTYRHIRIKKEKIELKIVSNELQTEDEEEFEDLMMKNSFTPQSYKNKYFNFICSPRSNFIYETVR